MVDFVFIVEGRVLRRDELGRPAKQRHNGRADDEETAQRNDKADDHTERHVPRIHVPRIGEATDA